MITRIYIPGMVTREMNSIFQWCLDHFGEYRDQWNYNIMTGNWEFRKSSDAVLFALRWS